MVVMFVDWPDKPASEAVDTAAARRTAREVDDWFQEQSMCRMGIDFTIIPQHVRMPKPTTEYSGGMLENQMSDAIVALREMTGDTSYNRSNYHTFIMDYPTDPPAHGVGGPGSVWAHFQNGVVLRHELAHAFGLAHEDQPEVDIGNHITPYGRSVANWISTKNTDGFTYKAFLNTDETGTACDTIGAIRIYDIRSSIEVPGGYRMLRVGNPKKSLFYMLWAFYDAEYSSVALYVTDLNRNPPVYRYDFTPNSKSNKLADYEDGGMKTGDSYLHDASDIRISVVRTTPGTATEPGYAEVRIGCNGSASTLTQPPVRTVSATVVSYRSGQIEARFGRPSTGRIIVRSLSGRALRSYRCRDESRIWTMSIPQASGTYIVEVQADGVASRVLRLVTAVSGGRE